MRISSIASKMSRHSEIETTLKRNGEKTTLDNQIVYANAD